MYRDSTYIFFNSPSFEENAKEIKGMIQMSPKLVTSQKTIIC